jgi:hypothetical protein
MVSEHKFNKRDECWDARENGSSVPIALDDWFLVVMLGQTTLNL